jgi:DNA mismatch repair protein MutL
MGRIHILDGALADQIAAGEVVERPASVIKELIENALDAKARAITVEVREGGAQLMRVTDDGSGMDRDDASLCVLRHATSKLRTQADLEAICTLGFRGEALPSIASVSRFRLVTRTRDSVEGTEVVLEGGGPPQVSPVGCPVGTTVEVRDLFFNVPARKKFLKSSAAESAQIGEVCTRAALTDAGLRLTLIRDGRRVKEFLPAQDWAERAQLVVGGKHVRIEGERRGVKVRALLGAPEDARSGATALHVFVNGRPVRERQLARSVSFAYGSVMPPGRYPVGVVHLDLDPTEVDVNVHPQKAEVRFQRGREVMDALTHVLAQGLGTSAWKGPVARKPEFWTQRLPAGPLGDAWQRGAPEPAWSAPDTQARSVPTPLHGATDEPDPWGLTPTGAAATTPAAATPPSTHREAPGAPAQAPLPYTLGPTAVTPLTRDAEAAGALLEPSVEGPRLRALAQSKRLYIVCETPEGLCVIDQHAADERIHYDRLRRQYAAGEVRQQHLLLPEKVELSEREAALIEAHEDEIKRAGIEAALVGPTTAAVRAVPALLRRVSPERLLRDLLSELSRAGERAFGDAIDMALATMACHGAIRAGDPLSLPECQALLDGLSRIDDFGGHCPHGRPIVFEIPFSELARKVGR